MGVSTKGISTRLPQYYIISVRANKRRYMMTGVLTVSLITVSNSRSSQLRIDYLIEDE